MRKILAVVALGLAIFPIRAAVAASFDAFSGYICDASISESWSYEGYRAEDGAYLDMVFGRPPLTEVSKYGVEAHYIPDGEQTYYPFITRFPDGLWASPATAGKRFDAVLTWKSTAEAEVRVTGAVTLKGNLMGEAEGKKIKALLVSGPKELWSSDIAGGRTAEFDVVARVKPGDRVRLHIVNTGDAAGNLTLMNMKVDAGEK